MTKLLVVFDVDSTLIEDEVIELLADFAGSRAEVAEITERAMAGELDFSESLIERVATLAGLDQSVFEDVFESVRVTPGVPQTIAAIHAAGGKVGAVSGGFTQVLAPLADELNLDFQSANQLEIVDGKLTGRVLGKIIDREAKAQALAEWAAACGLEPEECIAVGDGANDLGMMEIAGLSVAFMAKPMVQQAAKVSINQRDMTALIPHLQDFIK